jgi:hypothetical protein
MGGTTVNAITSEAKMEKTTVIPIERVSIPVAPDDKAIGKKTITVVRVDAEIAIPTSEAPTFAALVRSSPFSICRKIFSITTMELSTIRPIPSAIPLNVIILSVSPEK